MGAQVLRALAGWRALDNLGHHPTLYCRDLGPAVFPSIDAVDPLRDLILFNTWPADWGSALLKLAGSTALSVVVGCALAANRCGGSARCFP
jgi:hypothetical protein